MAPLKPSLPNAEDRLSSLDDRLPSTLAAQIEKRLSNALESARSATQTAKAAEAAHARANDESLSPEERQQAEQEAKKLDKQAKSQLKLARRLQSGAWQGAGAGAGIGAATGLGLGTVVGTLTGTLVGGVAAIPTTALGGLIGAGTGAIHGPWVKIGRGDNEEGDKATLEGVEGLDGKTLQELQDEGVDLDSLDIQSIMESGGGDLEYPFELSSEDTSSRGELADPKNGQDLNPDEKFGKMLGEEDEEKKG
ncbi:uncharacterized protein BDR25DRAFT_299727 [Lindgomyces ingoldianus]|uniref:Uncharacterized protein n=1 Tax=Lindgomyces ingoldianus TaxID=673940 RepID=A0ACB6RFV6_9PLEO|nr:uncharacterized protein BDR25DRAFT_299727 [Lindgomyces ingoldianus]KAF2478001.1 hypothetical protein BDR25DRAFT_299727 [Lindgomyces ingoldianus]